MIDLYYWTTPNGHKVTIFLEEAGLEYKIYPVQIAKGEQFEPKFLKISPNNRIPAIVDHKPSDSSAAPLSLFESGAILLYLAEKTKKFLGEGLKQQTETKEWLFWQMAGLGPMLGQNHHFSHYAPEKIQYAIDRYVKETSRLYAVLNKQLEGRDFITGSYSIADMACYPWIVGYEKQGQKLSDFKNLERWFHTCATRPAVIRAYEKGREINSAPTVSEEAKKILFGQDASHVQTKK